jgi:hypothetical protein
MDAVGALERAQPAGRELHFMRDCDTRWTSTLLMFQRCQTLIPAVLSLHLAVQQGKEDSVDGLDEIVELINADLQRQLTRAVAVRSCCICTV